MEKIKSLGTAISDIIGPTMGAYTPLLQANAKAIKSTPRETHSYGSHPRQELDVYKPEGSLDAAPVVVWVHGGGFVRGDKNLDSIPDDLSYANVGHFFASRGYIAILINYRLVDAHDGKFPSGGEDVATAVEWIIKTYGGNQRDLFLLGNSAGGVHVSTFLLYPQFHDTLDKVTEPKNGGVSLRGVGFVATPLVFPNPPPYRVGVLKAYFGATTINENCSLGVLNSAPNTTWERLERGGVQIKLITFEKDPEDEIKDTQSPFEEAWNKKQGSDKASKQLSTMLNVPGHNHISHFLALGTGIDSEEAWGNSLIEWMNVAMGRRRE